MSRNSKAVEQAIGNFAAMAKLHGFDNVVLIGTANDGAFQYLFQAGAPLTLTGVMERVKAELIQASYEDEPTAH